MSKWTTTDIPDQTGRTAVITGANTGLGYETAKALAAEGAHVVLAVRNLDKGKAAADLIAGHTLLPAADVPYYRHRDRMPLYPPGDPRNTVATAGPAQEPGPAQPEEAAR